MTTYIEHIQNKWDAQEKDHLLRQRRRLLREKQQSQCYVVISAADIPENVHIRPIYDMPGRIVAADPQRYAQLLDKLQGAKSQCDES